MKTWITGAVAGLMLGAGPAAALTLEEFFALPTAFVGATEGDVVYTTATDELDAFDDGSNPLLGILANVGGVITPPPGSTFGANALTAFVGPSLVTGSVEDLNVADDYIAILYRTTSDPDGAVDDFLALQLFFDGGTFTVDTLIEELGDNGPRFAFFELSTGAGETVIPLPATALLLGAGMLALGAARRRRG